MKDATTEFERPPDEARAVAAAVHVAGALGLRVDDPVVLTRRHSLRVHLRPSPVVARVPTWTALLRRPIAAWLARETAVAGYLAAEGAPVIPPTVEVDPGPHAHDGFAVSLWQWVPVEAVRVAMPQEFGRMPGELHAALRGYRGELPRLGPPAHDIPAALDRIERGALLPPDTIATLRRRHERLASAIEYPGGPLQALHGDAHRSNLVATPRGLLWNDFEDVCLGPVAWDFASLTCTEDVVRAYPNAPDATVRALYREVRQLLVAAWFAALPFEFEGRAAMMAKLVTELRTNA